MQTGFVVIEDKNKYQKCSFKLGLYGVTQIKL